MIAVRLGSRVLTGEGIILCTSGHWAGGRYTLEILVPYTPLIIRNIKMIGNATHVYITARQDLEQLLDFGLCKFIQDCIQPPREGLCHRTSIDMQFAPQHFPPVPNGRMA